MDNLKNWSCSLHLEPISVGTYLHLTEEVNICANLPGRRGKGKEEKVGWCKGRWGFYRHIPDFDFLVLLYFEMTTIQNAASTTTINPPIMGATMIQ